MIPWTEFRGPVGIVLILAMLVWFSFAFVSQTDTVSTHQPGRFSATGLSTKTAYPTVQIDVPGTSIFAPQYAY
jgi:hypothetical protein